MEQSADARRGYMSLHKAQFHFMVVAMTHPERPNQSPVDIDHIDTIYDELVAQKGDIKKYLQALDIAYHQLPVYASLRRIAVAIDPIDRSTGQAFDTKCSEAFFAGALLGLRVAQASLGNDFSRRISRHNIPVGDIDEMDADKFEQDHQIAASILDFGAAGYEQAASYHDFIEEYEDEMIPDIRYQAHMKRGFGFIMSCVYDIRAMDAETQRQIELKKLERELDHPEDIDWDGELEHLLSE